jgi:predicted DNA-binding WGR domain protein
MKLIYSDEKSNKFWDISVKGKAYTVTYGKVGSKGQSRTKAFDSPAKCKKAADKAIQEKLHKGYKEASGSKPI